MLLIFSCLNFVVIYCSRFDKGVKICFCKIRCCKNSLKLNFQVFNFCAFHQLRNFKNYGILIMQWIYTCTCKVLTYSLYKSLLFIFTVAEVRLKPLLSNIDEDDEGIEAEEEEDHNTLLMVPTLLDATSIYSQQSAITSPKVKSSEDKEKASDDFGSTTHIQLT